MLKWRRVSIVSIGAAALVASSCAAADAASAPTSQRIGVITKSGHAFVRQGVNGRWVSEGVHVTQLVLSGDRVGIVTSAGQAYVKQGSLGARFVKQADNIRQLSLAGNRVGVVTRQNRAYIKSTGLNNKKWQLKLTGVSQLVLSGNKLGIVTTRKIARTKSGSLNADFVTQAPSINRIAIQGPRLAALDSKGQIGLKIGVGFNKWRRLTTTSQWARDFAITDSRIGIIDPEYGAEVRANVDSKWLLVSGATKISRLVLWRTRVGVVTRNGVAMISDGVLGAKWRTIYHGVASIVLPND